MKTCCILLLCLNLPLQAQDRWLGYFESKPDNILLHIENKDSEGYLRGQLLHRQQLFPVKAFTLLGIMTGEIPRDNSSVLFGMYRAGDVWIFTIDEQEYKLRKVTQASFPAITEAVPVQEASASSGADASASHAALTKIIKDPGGAYTVQIPGDWKMTREEDVYVLTKSGEPAELRIFSHTGSDRKELLNEPLEELREDASNYLVPAVYPYRDNDVRYTFRGKLKGQNVQMEMLVLMSPHGGGVTLNATVTNSDRSQEYFRLLADMASTVVFSKPAADPGWSQKLSGKQLLYIKTVGTGSTKYYYNLYANGRYTYQYSYVYNSSGFSGSDRDDDEGTWKVESRGSQSVLILSGRKKGRSEFTLQQRSGSSEVYANGEKFFLKNID